MHPDVANLHLIPTRPTDDVIVEIACHSRKEFEHLAIEI